MIVTPVKTRIFKEGEDLVSFITAHVSRMRDRSVLAVASKIVALAEGRVAPDVRSKKAHDALVRKESDRALATRFVWVTLKDGVVMANAGIDESNVEGGGVILLPKDSLKSAEKLRKALQRKYRVKNLGILITDSRTIPLRAGVTGMAMGYAGFSGIKDYGTERDLFGRKFVYTKTNVADGLAAAATLAMGEGRERCPLAVIEKAPVAFRDKINPKEGRINLRDDMYRPFFAKL
jgi:coenzyme F420-0:L-glutamate ligase